MRRTSDVWQGFEALEDRQLFAAVFWDGGGGDGAWENPLNWSGDVLPGAADDVIVNEPNGNVSHSVGATHVHSLWTLSSFDMSGGSIETDAGWRVAAPLFMAGGELTGAGNLVLNSTMLWVAGSMSGAGKVQILPGRELDISGFLFPVNLSRTIVNNGTLVWESGDIAAAAGTIINLPGRTFEMRSDGTITTTPGTGILSNYGTILRTGTAGSTSTVALTLNNVGEVDVRNGTLSFTGAIVQREVPMVLQGGTWAVTGNTSKLELSGGPIDQVWAGLNGPTEIRLHGAGSQFPQLESATMIFSSFFWSSTLKLTGGRAFTFSSMVVVSNLVVSNPGITTVLSNNLAMDSLAVGAGKVVWTGGGRANSTHVVLGAELNVAGVTELVNTSGLGLLRISGETAWYQGTWTGAAMIIDPSGELYVSGRLFIIIPYNKNILFPPYGGDLKVLGRKLVNYGTVEWEDYGGEWRLGAEFVNRGMFKIKTPGFLNTGVGTGPGSAPAWISNYGTIEKEGAFDTTLRGAGGGVHLANYLGGTVHVKTGRLIASGGGLSSGAFIVEDGAEMVFGGLASALSGASLSGSGRFRIANASVWTNVQVDSGLTGSRDMIINPAGHLTLTGTQAIISRKTITNNGTISVAPGVQASWFGDLTNNGTLDLGGGLGTFQLGGNLTLSATSILRVGFAQGQQFSRLAVSDNVRLGGRVAMNFAFNPGTDADIDLLSDRTHSGDFASLEWVGLPTQRSVTLRFVAGPFSQEAGQIHVS